MMTMMQVLLTPAAAGCWSLVGSTATTNCCSVSTTVVLVLVLVLDLLVLSVIPVLVVVLVLVGVLVQNYCCAWLTSAAAARRCGPAGAAAAAAGFVSPARELRRCEACARIKRAVGFSHRLRTCCEC
jgi:hypothetical protein